jgi:signal transduction histidine kinase
VDDDLALAPGMELALFRIVQEALTNVVKHAPGAAVDVTVHRAGTEVVVAVTNTATGHPATDPPPGAGRGLIGVRQRADLYGGTMSAGPTTDGGYQLTVRLPIHQDSDPVAVTYPASAAS